MIVIVSMDPIETILAMTDSTDTTTAIEITIMIIVIMAVKINTKKPIHTWIIKPKKQKPKNGHGPLKSTTQTISSARPLIKGSEFNRLLNLNIYFTFELFN